MFYVKWFERPQLLNLLDLNRSLKFKGVNPATPVYGDKPGSKLDDDDDEYSVTTEFLQFLFSQ